jgi:hypothetical protein
MTLKKSQNGVVKGGGSGIGLAAVEALAPLRTAALLTSDF